MIYMKSLHVSAHNRSSSGHTNAKYVKEGNIKKKEAFLLRRYT